MFIRTPKIHFIIHFLLKILNFKEYCNLIGWQQIWSITQEPEFYQICDWWWNTNNNISFHSGLFPGMKHFLVINSLYSIIRLCTCTHMCMFVHICTCTHCAFLLLLFFWCRATLNFSDSSLIIYNELFNTKRLFLLNLGW